MKSIPVVGQLTRWSDLFAFGSMYGEACCRGVLIVGSSGLTTMAELTGFKAVDETE